MTIQQILEKIKQDHGEVVLGNGRQLLNLFADYSRGQLRPQTNALQVFVSCGGNERILRLQNASTSERQIKYDRLIQEMVSQHNMQERAASEVCYAFWRVAIGNEPPIVKYQQPAPGPKLIPPEPAPQLKPKPMPDTVSPFPEQQKRHHLHGKKERRAFMFGLIGVFISVPSLVVLAKKQIDEPVYYTVLLYMCITTFRTVDLWDHGFPLHPSGSFVSVVSKTYSLLACTMHCLLGTSFGIAALAAFAALAGVTTFYEDSVMNAWAIIFFLGMGASSICNATWHKNKKIRSGNA